MSESRTVTIRILDRLYEIACAQEELEQLMAATDLFSQQVSVLRTGHQNVPTDELVVIAALNVTRDLMQMRQQQEQIAQLGERVSRMKETLSDALDELAPQKEPPILS